MSRQAFFAGISAMLLAVLQMSCSSTALAVGVDPVFNVPKDERCVEKTWPFYYYRHPVIYQGVGHDGTIKLLGFGYMDACKQAGKGIRGGTSSTLQVSNEDVWVSGVVQRMQEWPLDGVSQALPGITHPGDNVFRWPLPDIPARFHTLYKDSAELLCFEPNAHETVCPGVPLEFYEEVLEPEGFSTFTDKFRRTRLLNGTADLTGAWFKSALSTNNAANETFYGRHWADDMREDHGDGGVIRIILNPIDLSLWDAPAETDMTGPDEAIVAAFLSNVSTRSQLKPTLGWRVKGSNANFQPVAGWRDKGQTEWRTGPVGPLLYQFKNPDTGVLEGYATHELQVLVRGVEAGQQIELMVNHDKQIAEAAIGGGAGDNAYANNIVTTRLKSNAVNMAVTSLTVPATATCSVGGQYSISWTLRNESASAQSVRRVVRVSTGKSGTWNVRNSVIALSAGDTRESASISVGRCDDTATVTVELNPDFAVAETNQNDNVRSASTYINPEQPASQSTTGGGGQKHQIVPSDCHSNPDVSSPYPCLNYPDLFIP